MWDLEGKKKRGKEESSKVTIEFFTSAKVTKSNRRGENKTTLSPKEKKRYCTRVVHFSGEKWPVSHCFSQANGWGEIQMPSWWISNEDINVLQCLIASQLAPKISDYIRIYRALSLPLSFFWRWVITASSYCITSLCAAAMWHWHVPETPAFACELHVCDKLMDHPDDGPRP